MFVKRSLSKAESSNSARFPGWLWPVCLQRFKGLKWAEDTAPTGEGRWLTATFPVPPRLAHAAGHGRAQHSLCTGSSQK